MYCDKGNKVVTFVLNYRSIDLFRWVGIPLKTRSYLYSSLVHQTETYYFSNYSTKINIFFTSLNLIRLETKHLGIGSCH